MPSAGTHRWIIGTSGFAYTHWRGIFYPPGLAQRRWFAFYQEQFQAIELNVTFYRTPAAATFEKWRDEARPGFRFVLKAPKIITHIQRLRSSHESFRLFWERASLLGERLAALLIQLPPSLGFDAALLDEFLAGLPPGLPPLAWEVRHASFATAAAQDYFREKRLPLVVADSGGHYPTVMAFTAAPAYLRFHGPGALFASPYTTAQLQAYVDWVRANVPAGTDVYAFFNNDGGGHAILNARQLAALVGA